MNITLPPFSRTFISQQKRRVDNEFKKCCEKKLDIDISRGIPSLEQLNLSQPLLSEPLNESYINQDKIDCRNYGFHQGLIELRDLLSPLMGVPTKQIIAHGNSSLSLMYDCISQAWSHGLIESDQPWYKEKNKISFLCVVPGYDRHFSICEYFGIRMISVPMLEDGPDIEKIKTLVAEDSSIKGMWCVPKYSNPTGTVYADHIIEALAAMPTAAKDFRLFWDNAYIVHKIEEVDKNIKNIYTECLKNGYENRPLIFSSTSKMTLPGHGVAFLGASEANVKWWLKAAFIKNVGPDKVNQLKQFRFLKNIETIYNLMSKHQKILKPKFDVVNEILTERLTPYAIATWTRPKGGYFISLNVMAGTAHQIVQLAKQAGIKFSTAGSCFPYGIDPEDSQLRIAPSFPEITELKKTMEIIAICIEKSYWDHLIQILPE